MNDSEVEKIYERVSKEVYKYRISHFDEIIKKYTNTNKNMRHSQLCIKTLEIVEHGDEDPVELPSYGKATSYYCKPALELLKQQNLLNEYPEKEVSKAQQLTEDINQLLTNESYINKKKNPKYGKRKSIKSRKNSPLATYCNVTSIFKGIELDDFCLKRSSTKNSVNSKKMPIEKNVSIQKFSNKSKISGNKSLKSSSKSNHSLKSQASQSVGKGLVISNSEDSNSNCKTNSSNLSSYTYNSEEVNSVDKERRDKFAKNALDNEISSTTLTQSSYPNFHQPQTCQSTDEGISRSNFEDSYTDPSYTNSKTSSLSSDDAYIFEEINSVDEQTSKATKNACNDDISYTNSTKMGYLKDSEIQENVHEVKENRKCPNTSSRSNLNSNMVNYHNYLKSEDVENGKRRDVKNKKGNKIIVTQTQKIGTINNSSNSNSFMVNQLNSEDVEDEESEGVEDEESEDVEDEKSVHPVASSCNIEFRNISKIIVTEAQRMRIMKSSSSESNNDSGNYEMNSGDEKETERSAESAYDSEISYTNLTKSKNLTFSVSQVDEGLGFSSSEDSYTDTLYTNCKINSSSLNNDTQHHDKWFAAHKQMKYCAKTAFNNEILGNNVTLKSYNRKMRLRHGRRNQNSPTGKRFLLQFGRNLYKRILT